MIVCICHKVSDKAIERHARAGASFDEIQMELGVATQCGKCQHSALCLVAQCQSGGNVAHLHAELQPLLTSV